MATLKFKQASPYSMKPSTPDEDIKHKEYLEHIKLSQTGHSRFGIACFGIGRAGTIHLSFLVREPKAKLLYIVDDDKSKWDKLKKYWNLETVRFLTNAEAKIVYEDPSVRAVVVASPTYTHEEIISNALNHNKAVFCEKPIAGDYDKIKALCNLAKKVNQPLFCAFNRRFDPSYATLRERVRKGEIGRVLTVKVCSRDSPLPTIEYLKASGGIFHDCAVHDIDMNIFMLGEYPTKVMVMATANIPEIAQINDHDTVGIMLSYESGAIGFIDLSRHSIYGYDQRVEVFGEKGMMKAENQQPISNLETYTEKSVTKAPIAYSFPSRYADGYAMEMKHFFDVLEGKAKVSVDSNDILAVSKIATACEEALRSGRCVDLKWRDDEKPRLA
ncbi:inositol 2-dehydrogenase-like [Tribolium madens]|uniref:inositol 2-dehydrogenase-like n=1 Tax=Tribolium madens TaxID=41895 RepID=UPI001CF72580|nr:inositol 2-dehydrogenase-like [Tribolium madens]